MWTYEQATGFLIDPNGVKLFPAGYAGKGFGKNNPTAQMVINVGPLPRGDYTLGEPVDHPRVGLFAIPLNPYPENEMFGRSDFFMHGDSLEHPGAASDGCIVQEYQNRVECSLSTDKLLRVVSGEEQGES